MVSEDGINILKVYNQQNFVLPLSGSGSLNHAESPDEFILAMRMKRAAKLLVDKNLPIGEIAFRVGFADNTRSFSTAFRKFFGKSPREFQNHPSS